MKTLIRKKNPTKKLKKKKFDNFFMQLIIFIAQKLFSFFKLNFHSNCLFLRKLYRVFYNFFKGLLKINNLLQF